MALCGHIQQRRKKNFLSLRFVKIYVLPIYTIMERSIKKEKRAKNKLEEKAEKAIY